MVVRNKNSVPASTSNNDTAPVAEVVAEVATAEPAKYREESLSGDDLLALVTAPEEVIEVPVSGKIVKNHKGTQCLFFLRNGVTFEAYPDSDSEWPDGLVAGARVAATLTVRKHGGSKSRVGDDGRRYVTVFFTAMTLAQ